MNRIFLSSLLVLLSTGCATALRGDKQKVKIDTDPSDAVALIDGSPQRTPATFVLKRKNVHTVFLSKEGYVPITFDYKAKWDGASIGNAVLPGGSVGFGVDTVGGADRQFNTLAKIKLTPTNGPTTQPVLMKEFRGRVVTPAQYDVLVEAEHANRGRFFGEQ